MFNSRNQLYRNPTGAVPEGTSVHFKITLPRELHCSAARLTVRRDKDNISSDYNMFWCGMNGDTNEWWECDCTAGEQGLYFYDFSLDTWRGKLRMSRCHGGLGTLEKDGPPWQLTVYDSAFQTPDWLAGGVMYQVFPDRFCRSNSPKENVPQDRKLHENWMDQPDWQPDQQGEITNSDYFGGDLKGITQKLPYLQSLGVTCLYLNPIFEAHSNHRYNTADYRKIDPLLGDEADFRELCAKAKKLGIRVLLDGVFSHTGSDSVYFNREKRYANPGAYGSQESPYYPWYHFKSWPNDYDSWWGFITLPNVEELNPQYNGFINGEGGVVRKWLDAGASGWRLDVADELPDGFLDALRAAAKAQNPDALVLGEVWEDASNKSAYGQRRRYLLGGQLDTVMNYPFRDAVLGFLTGANPADMLEIIGSIVENYPPQTVRLLMNHIGTHDTERAVTMLAGEPVRNHGRHWQSTTHLTKERRKRGIELLRLAAVMQYTLPGVPCIYYGDEAGMEGYKDPFNRACYPWGNENKELVEWYRLLGHVRKLCKCLQDGAFEPVAADGDFMAYSRMGSTDAVLVAVSIHNEPMTTYMASEWKGAHALIGSAPDENGALTLEPLGCAVLRKELPKEPLKRKARIHMVRQRDGRNPKAYL